MKNLNFHLAFSSLFFSLAIFAQTTSPAGEDYKMQTKNKSDSIIIQKKSTEDSLRKHPKYDDKKTPIDENMRRGNDSLRFKGDDEDPKRGRDSIPH